MKQSGIDLSIVIVSFNAPEYLKLTLTSVKTAIASITAEVLVVDNSNNKALQGTITANYPFVKLIENNRNLGFSKANNLALNKANGRLAVLLNPDTIVGEDTFIQIINYYRNNPKTGGLGVKMIDGLGNYLNESKRGFPSIKTSFFKLTGLYRLWPKSKHLAKYYEGHLTNNATQHVDILSGAFLVIPRNASGHFTLLDEQYFMYGEDIDLSCRLQKEHGCNVYLADTNIIHFKGQSTIVNAEIINHFYTSMWLFYKQHIKKTKSFLINFISFIGIKTLLHAHLLLALIKGSNAQKTRVPMYKNVLLVSDNAKLLQGIKEKLKTKVDLTHNPERVQAKELMIFDFKHIKHKDAISYIGKNKSHYGYITEDDKTLILSRSSKDKGQVIHLQ